MSAPPSMNLTTGGAPPSPSPPSNPASAFWNQYCNHREYPLLLKDILSEIDGDISAAALDGYRSQLQRLLELSEGKYAADVRLRSSGLSFQDRQGSRDVITPVFNLEQLYQGDAKDFDKAFQVPPNHRDIVSIFRTIDVGVGRQQGLEPVDAPIPPAISSDILTKLLCFYHVHPDILSYLTPLMADLRDDDASRFPSPALRAYHNYGDDNDSNNSSNLMISSLARSGIHFQINYHVDFLDKFGSLWTPQKTVVHHQFDVDTAASVWIQFRRGRGTQPYLPNVKPEESRYELAMMLLEASMRLDCNVFRGAFLSWEGLHTTMEMLNLVFGNRSKDSVWYNKSSAEDVAGLMRSYRFPECSWARSKVETPQDLVGWLKDLAKAAGQNMQTLASVRDFWNQVANSLVARGWKAVDVDVITQKFRYDAGRYMDHFLTMYRDILACANVVESSPAVGQLAGTK